MDSPWEIKGEDALCIADQFCLDYHKGLLNKESGRTEVY